jgi:hypothetical protein
LQAAGSFAVLPIIVIGWIDVRFRWEASLELGDQCRDLGSLVGDWLVDGLWWRVYYLAGHGAGDA